MGKLEDDNKARDGSPLTATPCSECGAFQGHHPLCPHLTGDDAIRMIKSYYEAWLRVDKERRAAVYRAEEKVRAARDKTALWHGKWEILRRENNALRRKLNPPNAKDTREAGQAKERKENQ